MKEHKTTEELIQYLVNKNVKINDIEKAKKNIEKYTYYGIVNTYKFVFKDKENYKANVTFEEIFALFLFDKAIKRIFLNYLLEIELVIKSRIADLLSEKYGVEDYIQSSNFDEKVRQTDVENLVQEINNEITGKHNSINDIIREIEKRSRINYEKRRSI